MVDVLVGFGILLEDLIETAVDLVLLVAVLEGFVLVLVDLIEVVVDLVPLAVVLVGFVSSFPETVCFVEIPICLVVSTVESFVKSVPTIGIIPSTGFVPTKSTGTTPGSEFI